LKESSETKILQKWEEAVKKYNKSLNTDRKNTRFGFILSRGAAG